MRSTPLAESLAPESIIARFQARRRLRILLPERRALDPAPPPAARGTLPDAFLPALLVQSRSLLLLLPFLAKAWALHS
jgi:hypothetical protein